MESQVGGDMAERRMFAKSIVLSDVFLDMPMSARCLYFTLGMLADDDGFVGSPKSIMRQCGATDDDMKVLLAKRYVLGFESGVIVIKHWKMNNYLRSDRYNKTTYLEEKELLEIDDKGAYTEKNKDGIPEYNHLLTQDRLGKDSIGKDNNNSNELLYSPTCEQVSDVETFISLPLLKNKQYNITLDEVEEYKKLFPAIDVEQELRNAVAWIIANPKNKKSNGKRFITNWLIRQQEKTRAYSNRKESGVTYIDIK